MSETEHDTDRDAVRMLRRVALFELTALGADLRHTDWGDPGAAALAEKRARIIGAFINNIEKVAVHAEPESDVEPLFTDEDDAWYEEQLRARIDRMADRVRGDLRSDHGGDQEGQPPGGLVGLDRVGEAGPEGAGG